MDKKPLLAIYKFTSCDGCQLAFLNAGELLLQLSHYVEIQHFAEGGYVDVNASVDIAFIEGSISTPDELEKIKKIREQSRILITIGACATAGGIQALRNFADYPAWIGSVYASVETIHSLNTSTPISAHVKVDHEIWGCPVNTEQVFAVIKSFLQGASPRIKRDSVCLECKRKGNICVLVTKSGSCMGPVTQMGCGAICPTFDRACYACYGPSQNPNPASLAEQFRKNEVDDATIARYFLHINNQAPAFKKAGMAFKGIPIVSE